MPNAKYIIEPTPFKLRSQSPLNNWATISYNKPSLKDQVGTGVGVSAPVRDQTEFKHGAQVFIDENENKTSEFNTNLKDRIKGADNIAKKTRLEGKLGRKEKRQAARADKIQRRNDKRNPQTELTEKIAITKDIKPSTPTVESVKFKINKGTNLDTKAVNTDIDKIKARHQKDLLDRKNIKKDSNKTTNAMGDDIAEYLTSGGNVPDSLKPKTNEEIQEEMREIQKKLQIEDTIGKGDTFRSGINYNSPLNYNPFSPRQQDIVGQVYNPSGNDISEFQDGQAFNKSASNPNTYNQPAIPTEADTTMNDLQTGNAPMGAFGDDLSGAMMSPTGLAPEQGMGSTQFGGVTPNLTRKEIRRQRRQENRQYRRTGIRPFGG